MPKTKPGDFLTPNIQLIIAFSFGLVFLLGMVYIAFVCPNPTPFQYTIFRAVLALAAAGIASMVPGFLTIEWSVPSWIVRAGGALGVGLLVYLVNPAELLGERSKQDVTKPSQAVVQTSSPWISGVVESHSGASLSNAKVYVEGHSEEAVITNEHGEFKLPTHDVVDETLRIKVTKAGYQPLTQDVQVSGPVTIFLDKK